MTLVRIDPAFLQSNHHSSLKPQHQSSSSLLTQLVIPTFRQPEDVPRLYISCTSSTGLDTAFRRQAPNLLLVFWVLSDKPKSAHTVSEGISHPRDDIARGGVTPLSTLPPALRKPGRLRMQRNAQMGLFFSKTLR